MARKNPERRQEFIAAAQRLFFTKGYEKTSINDLLKEVGVSKGAFYHHFESKQEVLEAIVENFMNQAIFSLQEIISDQSMSALDKCQKVLQLAFRWKMTQETEIAEIRRLLRTDSNIILFHKLQKAWLKAATPKIAMVIQQGNSEGVFDVENIAETSTLLLTITSTLTDEIVALESTTPDSHHHDESILKKLEALQTAVERLLGAPSGSIPIIDEHTDVNSGQKNQE